MYKRGAQATLFTDTPLPPTREKEIRGGRTWGGSVKWSESLAPRSLPTRTPPKECWGMVREHKTRSAERAERILACQCAPPPPEQNSKLLTLSDTLLRNVHGALGMSGHG